MDLHAITLPGAIGDLHFEVADFTGWDRLWSLVLPNHTMVLIVAVKIGREVVKRGGQDRQVTFRMPDGRVTWQVVFGPRLEGVKGDLHSITTRPWKFPS